MEYPPYPQVGVGAVVLVDDKILLVQRINPPGAGKWSVPGGHLKLGESIYKAAKRELYEEAGVEGEAIGIVNIDEYVEYDGKIRFHYVLIDVLIRPRIPPTRLKPGGDVSKASFFSLKESLNLDLTRSTRSLITKILDGYSILNSNFIYIDSSMM